MSLIALLQADAPTAIWLEELSLLSGDLVALVPPALEDVPDIFRRLRIPDADQPDLARYLTGVRADPDRFWLIQHASTQLVRGMGDDTGDFTLPLSSRLLPNEDRYLPVAILLAALPHVLAYHQQHGVPDDVSWESLSDLGRSMQQHRDVHGVGGLAGGDWLTRHFRGTVYRLGRLQFERGRLGRRNGQAVAAAGLPFGTGDPALSVHIPGLSGPLTPSACDASLMRASRFFAGAFPDTPYAIALCHSWLLDPQLGEYLAPDSNIMQFQRRFQLTYRQEPDPVPILESVFGRADLELAAFPQTTTLERAVVQHLQAGRHWQGGAGWMALLWS